jgi:prepilin peptidase CpaA
VSLTDMPDINTGWLLLPFLAIAVAIDIWSRRIPNVLVVVILSLGLAAQATTYSAAAVLWSLGGILVGFLILMPFYAFGRMGAGDVKLLAAAGSFLGPAGALIAGIVTLGAGGLLGLGVRAWHAVAAFPVTVRLGIPRVPDPGAVQLPYSVAIAAGTLMVMLPW